jgi:hypothetical protein
VPDVPAAEGVVVRLAGDLGLRANTDVRDRAFAMIDHAQLPYALKEQVYGALDDNLGKTVGELVALGTPPELQSALLELYVADAMP